MLRTAENVTLSDKNGLPVVIKRQNKHDNTPLWVIALIIVIFALGCLMGGEV